MTEPKKLMTTSLDTSGFAMENEDEYEDTEDYNASYFDIEKSSSPSSNRREEENGASSAKFETNMFDLGPLSEEYSVSEEDYRDASASSSPSFSSVSLSVPSQSSPKTSLSSMPRRPSNSKVPIRNVLDIFQELKLSFGRKSRR